MFNIYFPEMVTCILDMLYSIVGNFSGETLVNLVNNQWLTKLKLSQLVLTINNLLVDLLIHPTLLYQMLEKSQFAKVSPCQTFPLYDINKIVRSLSMVVVVG